MGIRPLYSGFVQPVKISVTRYVRGAKPQARRCSNRSLESSQLARQAVASGIVPNISHGSVGPS